MVIVKPWMLQKVEQKRLITFSHFHIFEFMIWIGDSSMWRLCQYFVFSSQKNVQFDAVNPWLISDKKISHPMIGMFFFFNFSCAKYWKPIIFVMNMSLSMASWHYESWLGILFESKCTFTFGRLCTSIFCIFLPFTQFNCRRHGACTAYVSWIVSILIHLKIERKKIQQNKQKMLMCKHCEQVEINVKRSVR